MEFLLDIIFIAIAIVMIILGAKKGLVKALLDGLSTIISGIIAYMLATPVAKIIYDLFVRSIVKGELEKALNDSGTDFGSISESVIRFAPIEMNDKQFASVHSENEHISLESIANSVVFYKHYLKNYR